MIRSPDPNQKDTTLIMNPESWDERFSRVEFIYGVEPNEYFRSNLKQLTAGKLLLPGEGEGRNAVFAVLAGWEVDAFDSSSAARAKANQLAQKNNVTLNYQIAEHHSLPLSENFYDAAALIYIHLTGDKLIDLVNKIFIMLKPGGIFIMEGFSKNQLRHTSGGRKELSILYSLEDIIAACIDFDFQHLVEEETELSEGKYHSGTASVVRFTGIKPL